MAIRICIPPLQRLIGRSLAPRKSNISSSFSASCRASDTGIEVRSQSGRAIFSQAVKESKNSFLSLGKINYRPSKTEIKSKIFRRSIYASQNIKKGELFNPSNVKVIRPGYGLQPKYFEKIIGKKSRRNIKKATPLKKNDYR